LDDPQARSRRPEALGESAQAPALASGLGGDDGGVGHGGPVQPVAGREGERERGQIGHSIISPCLVVGSIASYGNTTNENDEMDTRYRSSRRGTANRTRLASHDWVGVPPSVYRRQAARATGVPSCVAKQVTRSIRNRETRTHRYPTHRPRLSADRNPVLLLRAHSTTHERRRSMRMRARRIRG
jgi:hypothetical protein